MGKTIIELDLKDWEPYLSPVPENVENDIKWFLYKHFGSKKSVTKKAHLIVEVVE